MTYYTPNEISQLSIGFARYAEIMTYYTIFTASTQSRKFARYAEIMTYYTINIEYDYYECLLGMLK